MGLNPSPARKSSPSYRPVPSSVFLRFWISPETLSLQFIDGEMANLETADIWWKSWVRCSSWQAGEHPHCLHREEDSLLGMIPRSARLSIEDWGRNREWHAAATGGRGRAADLGPNNNDSRGFHG
jgi:hypothetical protein